MAMTNERLFIPFKGGLDTYSNTQLLPPGSLTASMGTMLDRPGTAYPGPGFTASRAVSLTGDVGLTNDWVNHGIGSLTAGPSADAAQQVVWNTRLSGQNFSTQDTGILNIGADTSTRKTLQPWRQCTDSFRAGTGTGVFTTNTEVPLVMTCPPLCAIGSGFAFYVWTVGLAGSGALTNTAVCMAYQNLATRAWTGPYFLGNNPTDWSVNYTSLPAYVPGTIQKIALACDGTYFRLGVLLSSGALTIYSYACASNQTTNVDQVSIATVSDVDACGTGDESNSGYAVFCYVRSVSHRIDTEFFSYAATTATNVTNIIPTLAAPSTAPISCSPIRTTSGVSTGFTFVAINSTPRMVVATTSLTGGSLVTTTITNALPGAAGAWRNISIINSTSGSPSAGMYVAIESAVSGTVQGQNYYYAPTYILSVSTAGGAHNTLSTLTGWGGIQMLGKWSYWYDGTKLKYLIAVRSGWAATGKTWGTAASAGDTTPAYPTGYLYDQHGVLQAKFGDSDVGSDTLWGLPGSATYLGSLNPALTSSFTYTQSTGQRTLTYPWPQLGFFTTISTRTQDSGSIIGGQCGLSTVTWLAPTASEPAPQMLQFQGLLTIPGVMTAYYDGSNLFEAGYFARCPTPIISSVGSGGHLLDATNYFYQAVMAYYDNAGNIHYSAPSLRVYGITTAANDTFSISIPLWKQSLRGYPTTPIIFLLYRSTGDPGTAATDVVPMYLIQQVVNDLSQTAFVVTTDGVADADITGLRSPYTSRYNFNASAGTASPPPFDSLTVWNSQLWGIANRNGPELWCSWPEDESVIGREGPAWSPANRIPLPAEIGQPKALVGLDEKLLIFGTRSDYGILGQAPPRSSSVADQPNLFSAPLVLPTPGGLRALNGITRLPDGILLQGTQGIVLLGRDLKYSPVGLPVKDFSRANLYLPGVFLPEQQAVLLFCANDTTQNLMFFYDTGEWAQFEQPPADDINSAAAGVIVGAVRAVAGQTSQVYAIAATQNWYFSIDPFSKYMRYRTPWIEMEEHAYGSNRSIAGYGILREAHILGTLPDGYPGRQTVTLSTEYDYANNTVQPAESQTLTLTAASQAELEYQWRYGFNQGNCKRARFTVTVDGGQRASNGSDNASVLLTGIMLSYDVDAGLSRMGAANSTGT